MRVSPEMRRAKEEVERELLNRPGVVGVDIGFKEVGGKPTDQLAIRVLVEHKKNVPQSQRVPEEISGFVTDVIQRKFELHVLAMPATELKPMVDTATYDPLQGGVSIGPCRLVAGLAYAGTLGVIVTDNSSGKAMMLSNFHVMAVDSTWSDGDAIAQPSRLDTGSCPDSIAGSLRRASVGGQVDCAVAEVTGRSTACEVVEIGAINGVGTVAVGQAVRKRGRTSGLTYGIVDTTDLTMQLDYGGKVGQVTLTNQIGIKPDTSRNPKFGDKGDSGAVVVDDKTQLVGLYFAGDDTGYGAANPIAAVLSALDVTACTGSSGGSNPPAQQCPPPPCPPCLPCPPIPPPAFYLPPGM